MKKILIVNRGEIAVRIIRAVREMGYQALVVYSEPDANSLACKLSDVALPLGGKTALESYLDVEKIMSIAIENKVDGIHPGYGFLSEKIELVKSCQKEGICFIGPSIQGIEIMGDKIRSKECMEDGGVPVIPGFYLDELDESDLHEKARELGYPVMVKAAAGGGGKGMRKVFEERDLQPAIQSCSREAGSSFNDARVFVEKLVLNPRHIEIQVFGDHFGRLIHLNERECSIQRRNQKILEECPSVCMDEDLREKMGAAAIRAAELVNYHNAGTVEFILDGEKNFYFLEMNTRLQVEHPVTEEVHGVDLVKEQIRVAFGEPLSIKEPVRNGWALECRIYAEEPAEEFRPSCGKILKLVLPEIDSLRIDSGVQEGDEVSPFYDPMIAKFVSHGENREKAIEIMRQALRETVLFGIETNLSYLQRILNHPSFIRGNLSTGFLEEHPIHLQVIENPDQEILHALSHSFLKKGASNTPGPFQFKGGSQ